jgi:hypothetical protein
MGHYSEFGCALWGTVTDLDLFCGIAHSTGFGYELQAIVQDFVICYRPLRRIWLSAMGRGAALNKRF